MSRERLGILFIVAGVVYGTTILDMVYNHSIGWLAQHNWIKQETVAKAMQQNSGIGRKPLTFFYSLALIIIGIFLLWNRNN